MPETNRIEYKQSLTGDLEKEVVAFLNYPEGGVIYFGLDTEGHVVGTPDSDGDMLKIKDRLKNNILPSCLGLFDLVHEEREDRSVIKLIVASGQEKPYYLKRYGMSERGCFIRTGTAAEPMPVKMIEELFSKRTRNSIGKITSPRQDLTFEQLKIYYEAAGIDLNKNFASNLELVTEEGKYNYAAYLLADRNNLSIKVASYHGTSRTQLAESNEYGQESLIKATKQVLDKIDVANRTITRITPRERESSRLWDPVAIREAVINAFVHNDFSKEVPPKFEIFSDRIEITSAGGLPEGLSRSEFFEGFSVPRNRELMRVFRDLELVEQLGSGVLRILDVYSRDCFSFSDNFLRMAFPIPEIGLLEEPPHDTPHDTPQATPHDTPHDTPHVDQLVSVLNGEMHRDVILEKLDLKDRKNFRDNYLSPAFEANLIEYTIPDKPKSKRQKYRLTEKGVAYKRQLLRRTPSG